MSTPMIWIIFPILFSVALFIFRKQFWLVCLLQSGVSLVLALAAIFSRFIPGGAVSFLGIEISPVLNFLGRSLILDHTNEMVIIILYSYLTFWTISLYIHQIHSLIVPIGLLFNALLIAAIAVEPFLYSGLIMEIAVIASIPVITENSLKRQKGIFRYLIYFTLGMAFILLAGWYLAGGEISPVNEEQLVQATVILGLGFVFWLAVFPFHTWIPSISDNFQPVNSFYILVLMPIAVFVLLIKYLNGFAWLRGYQAVYQALNLLGAIMSLTGAIWAVFQQGLRRTAGYLLIFSSGLMLMSAGLHSSQGFIISSYFILPRLINFFLLAWSLIILEHQHGQINISSIRSLFYTNPFTAVAFIISLFSTAAIPFSPGFSPVMAVLQLINQENPITTGIIIFCMLILSIRFIQWTYLITRQTEDEDEIKEVVTAKIFFGVLIFLLLLSGIFPNFFFSTFESFVNGYDFLVQ